MEIRLHANARTTPKIRAYIQASRESVRSLSSELGVTETTSKRSGVLVRSSDNIGEF